MLSLADSYAYFPLRDGNHWLLGATTEQLDMTGYYAIDFSASGPPSALVLHGDAAPTFYTTPSAPSDRRLQLDDSGVRNVDNAPGTVPSYHEVLFPLRTCSSFVAYDVTPEYSDDIDGDGLPDPLHRRAIVTVGARAPVAALDGTVIDDAIRFERTFEETVTSSNTGKTTTKSRSSSVEWWARGLGLVARDVASLDSVTHTQALVGVTVDGTTHGLQRLALIMRDLGSGDSEESPGPPLVAFDGARFFVVAPKPSDSPLSIGPTLVGTFVGLDGVVGPSVTLATDTSQSVGSHRLVFDGSAYVLLVRDSTGLQAVRVTPDGIIVDRRLLDSGTDDGILALGKDRLLVVYSRNFGPTATDSELDAVTLPIGGGAPSPRFTIAAGNRVVRSAAFDGTNFLVAWHEQIPIVTSADYGNTDVYAARVTPAGQVLDAPPIAIATTDGARGESRGRVRRDRLGRRLVSRHERQQH